METKNKKVKCDDCVRESTALRAGGGEDITDTFDEVWKENKVMIASKIGDLDNENFRRFMCDVCGVGYHADKERLMQLISEKLCQTIGLNAK